MENKIYFMHTVCNRNDGHSLYSGIDEFKVDNNFDSVKDVYDKMLKIHQNYHKQFDGDPNRVVVISFNEV